MLKIYTDGASRGNPGRAAIAYAIFGSGENLIESHSEPIGLDTNNVAEYKALIAALDAAAKHGKEAVCFSDSKLMVSQLNGEYKVKKPHLKKLHEMVMERAKRFKKIEFRNLPREDKNIAFVDMLANRALDSESK